MQPKLETKTVEKPPGTDPPDVKGAGWTLEDVTVIEERDSGTETTATLLQYTYTRELEGAGGRQLLQEGGNAD